LAMEKSKQMEILIQGRWSNKNFVKWWRIDEVSMNLVDEGSWWIFTFGGKNSYKLLWIVIMIQIQLQLKLYTLA
jgi:hypothetical protein